MPGLYIPVAGDVLTAANAITYWSKQVVIQCTSGTRPSSPVQGMVIFQTDTNTLAVYGTAWCEITPYGATVATAETTTSTSYTNLTTSGPAVTVQTGTKAFVGIHAGSVYNTTIGAFSYMSFAVSGATTLAAADGNSCSTATSSANYPQCDIMRQWIVTGLTAGSNVFTGKYRVSANTSNFANRDITVSTIPT